MSDPTPLLRESTWTRRQIDAPPTSGASNLAPLHGPHTRFTLPSPRRLANRALIKRHELQSPATKSPVLTSDAIPASFLADRARFARAQRAQ